MCASLFDFCTCLCLYVLVRLSLRPLGAALSIPVLLCRGGARDVQAISHYLKQHAASSLSKTLALVRALVLVDDVQKLKDYIEDAQCSVRLAPKPCSLLQSDC